MQVELQQGLTNCQENPKTVAISISIRLGM